MGEAIILQPFSTTIPKREMELGASKNPVMETQDPPNDNAKALQSQKSPGHLLTCRGHVIFPYLFTPLKNNMGLVAFCSVQRSARQCIRGYWYGSQPQHSDIYNHPKEYDKNKELLGIEPFRKFQVFVHLCMFYIINCLFF